MVPSERYQYIFDVARKYMVTLRADDPRFHKSVRVVHQDGSMFFIEDAFLWEPTNKQMVDAKQVREKCIIVIPEHHDVHVFYKDDLHDWGEYNRPNVMGVIRIAPPDKGKSIDEFLGRDIGRKDVIKALKLAGWTVKKGLWSTTKRGLKRHTQYGLSLREAASLEGLQSSESLS